MDLSNGWHRVPVLFTAWDEDGSGGISRHELALGVRKLCASKPLIATESIILSMMDDVDVGEDHIMDPVEFGAFLAAFSDESDIPLEEVVNFLLSLTSESLSESEEERLFQNLETIIQDVWLIMPHLFDTWDTNGSGTIDRSELTTALGDLIDDNGLTITVEECISVLEEVDSNGNKQLDRNEFGYFLYRLAISANVTLDELTFYMMKYKAGAQTRIIKIDRSENIAVDKDLSYLFSLWDQDNSGYLDRNEVKSGIDNIRRSEGYKLSTSEVMKVMDEADMDHNSTLDKMEFGAFLARFALVVGFRLDEVTKILLEERMHNYPQQSKISSFLAETSARLATEA